MSKICLNMIVKNESKIIIRMLSSVLPLIDTYCICDTGSTDDTKEMITTFFDSHNITGKVVSEPFRDFGYNRTFALKQCNDMPNSDYLLLLDADMILEIPETFSIDDFKTSLIHDAYYMFQGSQQFFYKNIRILKNKKEVSYWGVTHEYINLPKDADITELPRTQFFINDIGDGGSKTDKFVRDINLLKQGLVENPDNDRYTFYLANSYKDAGQYQNAIDTYKKRITIGGWKQEVWYSYYMIGKCYTKLNDAPTALFYWLEAYEYYPDRIENLYEIVRHYRLKGQNRLAYHYYEIADRQRNNNQSTDHLFYHKDIYDYKLDYEFTIISYYCNIANLNVYKSFMKVLTNPNVENNIHGTLLRNYKFYAFTLKEQSIITDYINQLNNIHSDIDIGEQFTTSTPSICMNKDNVYINTRCVDYRIDEHGRYTNNKVISTKNLITIFDKREPCWKKTDEFIVKYDETHDGLYVGIEDIRLIMNNGELHFNGNRGIEYKNIRIETGTIDLLNQQTNSSLVWKENTHSVEKNWVLFNNNNNTLNVIYQWYPLTIGEYKKNDENPIQFEPTNIIKTPAFFKQMRGSTNGVIIDDDIWFITHLVSDEERRYYYHIFVVLDKNTYEVKKYSNIFTFEGEKIEYTLGFIYMEEEDQFVIGYSTNDSTTKFMSLDKKNVEKLF